MSRLTAWCARAAVLVTFAATIMGSAAPADARSVAHPPFDPANIISDDTFFNYQSMSASGVQQFLENEECTPNGTVPCLWLYHQKTHSIAASPGHCAAYSGRRSESASSIIWRVAQACALNPQVLIVLLQKEQSLVTRPSASGYQKATGYACPDTAACDAKFFGFFNQVYQAAWQFREYTLHPDEFRYRVGPVSIQYHPNRACGSRVVDIADQATANLYDYTPYQPNAQTLAHPHGPAGACSAYGNLNFSRLFNAWFGSPVAVRFGVWMPPCLNFVGGHDCPVVKPFDGLS
jgi:hypothetical protein